MTQKNKKTKIGKLQDEVKKDTGEELMTSEKSETVSKKKVVYIELDDEVTAVYDKVKQVTAKHVYIVAPKMATLFQSVVNLKILKRKADDEEKKIYLITNDRNGIHLAQKVGIEVYNQSDSDGKPALFNTEISDERLRITPLKASINDIEEDAPTRIAEKKLSISEVLRKRTKILDVGRIDSMDNKKLKKPKSKFVIISPNRHALIGLVALSLVILLVIVYVALPGVTVYLTPTASILEKSVNITLADYQKNRGELETDQSQVIASYPISTTVSKTITHFSTGKKFSAKGANASGKITVINTNNTPWPLMAKTRFQSKDGIIFRLADAVTVPAASSQGPGKLEIFVIADQLDSAGLIAGERGNIEAGRFFLPGLKESSRSLLYAESYSPMTGGVTDYTSFIAEADIEAAKGRLSDELIKSSTEELKAAIKKQNDLTGANVTYILLEGEKAMKIGTPSIKIEPNLVGKEVSEFQVSGTVDVSGVYYDHDQMLEILKNELLLKKSPQKELVKVNESSTSYRIFEWNEAKGRVKLTANIKGIEQFEISPEKESGVRIIDKIKEHIIGKGINEAKIYIQNLPEVNKVEIESWPAWAPTIPSITDNIDFVIREASIVK